MNEIDHTRRTRPSWQADHQKPKLDPYPANLDASLPRAIFRRILEPKVAFDPNKAELSDDVKKVLAGGTVSFSPEPDEVLPNNQKITEDKRPERKDSYMAAGLIKRSARYYLRELDNDRRAE